MAGRLLLRANCWLNKLFCRSDVLGDPVVVARFDVRMFYGFAGNHIGLRVAEDEGRSVILDDLLHLDDDVSTLSRVEFGSQLIGECIVFRVGVAGAVLRVGAVGVGLPVHVDEDFRIACLFGENVGDQEVIFAAGADAVEDVVVDVLQVDFDADFLSVRLGSFCEEGIL